MAQSIENLSSTCTIGEEIARGNKADAGAKLISNLNLYCPSVLQLFVGSFLNSFSNSSAQYEQHSFSPVCEIIVYSVKKLNW